MKLLEYLERIERIDQLIRLKATGKPKCLARKIGVSERSIHRFINEMRNMGAPIFYSIHYQSYCYKKNVKFKFGFYVSENSSQKMYGGFDRSIGSFFRLTSFGTPSNYLC